MLNYKYDTKKHARLLEVGRAIEKGVTHELEPEMIDGIIATFDVLGVHNGHLFQIVSDLCDSRWPSHNNSKQYSWISYNRATQFVPMLSAKYKIYDWLGMMYSGRCIIGKPEDEICAKIVDHMVDHYIAMKHVGGWAWSYRGHIDLQIELEIKRYVGGIHCQDCIDSYESWHSQTPDERQAENDAMIEAFGGKDNVFVI